jgi:succinyl-CoA synthetase beta subunit
MKIHEYQAKELFKQYNIPVPEGKLALSTEEAVEIANYITGVPCVVKAQVHSGARGKAGGVKLARNIDELRETANHIIGMELSSIQTAGEVKKVRKVLIEEAAQIDKEYYLSLVLDRSNECTTIIASTEGGMDIEEIAQKTPELIYKVKVDIRTGLEQAELTKLTENLKLNNGFTCLITNLYRLFIEKDCSLVEINPLVRTKDNKIIALDAKINFDDNALYRNPDIAALRDIEEENPLEVEASKYNLNYIKLNGTVGCMVNGAGLAMATMDIVKLAGAEPANFLDVGGGASTQNIENAFKLLISDKNVNLVFINIFGGILRCDILAEGIKNAVSSLNVSIPVIVRLEGTNAEIGRKILNESGLKFMVCNSLNDAVSLIREALGVKIK